MDPIDALKLIHHHGCTKRAKEVIEKEIRDSDKGTIKEWEVEMRVSQNGRIKLCSYILQIRGSDLCCFLYDNRKPGKFGDLKILHSLISCEAKIIYPEI
jgi:hypothetical protein